MCGLEFCTHLICQMTTTDPTALVVKLTCIKEISNFASCILIDDNVKFMHFLTKSKLDNKLQKENRTTYFSNNDRVFTENWQRLSWYVNESTQIFS